MVNELRTMKGTCVWVRVWYCSYHGTCRDKLPASGKSRHFGLWNRHPRGRRKCSPIAVVVTVAVVDAVVVAVVDVAAWPRNHTRNWLHFDGPLQRKRAQLQLHFPWQPWVRTLRMQSTLTHLFKILGQWLEPRTTSCSLLDLRFFYNPSFQMVSFRSEMSLSRRYDLLMLIWPLSMANWEIIFAWRSRCLNKAATTAPSTTIIACSSRSCCSSSSRSSSSFGSGSSGAHLLFSLHLRWW